MLELIMVVRHDGPMTITFGADPVLVEVKSLLARLEAGEVVDRRFEGKRVDLKEEAGRRDKTGKVLPGSPENEKAAVALADEAACMANTPGGGALIIGIADDGALVGADLHAEWLRQRIFQLTQRLLTVEVSEVTIRGTRLLVLVAPSAVQPVPMNKRIKWRVNDECVEVDPTTWHARRMRTLNYDWSADSSAIPATNARPQALSVARDFLLANGEDSAEELARASDGDLLRRLNAVTGEGMLTNAGALLFIGRTDPCIDYIHRDYAGGDSTARVRRSGRSLLEELAEVFLTVEANNATRHLQAGLVVRQVRDIPPLAAREAIVNGVAHREWGPSAPTVVEHIGRTIRVTSPGGFFGGVNASNIITHPSQSRNPSLTQLLADLRIAEREGVGVDRMVREMIRLGYQPPVISEISGPFVRASLVGDVLDEPWIDWLAAIEPAEEAKDVSSLLLLHHVVTTGWVDEKVAAPLVQLPIEEARGAVLKLSRAKLDGLPLLQPVNGTPDGSVAAWHLTQSALGDLLDRDRGVGHVRKLPSRGEVAVSYAQVRGRISSTELGSLVGASGSNVGATLKALAGEGLLTPSNATGRGRGFFYRWAEAASTESEEPEGQP